MRLYTYLLKLQLLNARAHRFESARYPVRDVAVQEPDSHGYGRDVGG